MIKGKGFWVSLALTIVACGGDDDDGGTNTTALAASCRRNCDAQAAVSGCMPQVGLELCQTLCDASAQILPAECSSQYTAYYDCTVEAGFECSSGYVTQSICDTPGAPCADGCSALANGLGACQGVDMECEGADENGSCPQVECPCPSGPVPTSGVTYVDGNCACMDTTTCLELC